MPPPSAELPEPGDDAGSVPSVKQGGVPAKVPDADAQAVWPSGRIEGRKAFDTVLRQAFELAAQQGCKAWWWADDDFADWPLGARATVEALNAWAGSGRRLYLLARDFRLLQAHQPRFVSWRRTWDHVIEARACPGLSADDMPSCIWTPQWAMRRLDPMRSVAVCGTDAVQRTSVRLQIDEAWARAIPAFPATVLGL